MADENTIENEDEGVEVELDAPEQEEGVAAQSESVDQDDELDNYSQKVQSRIKKLTEKYRKEERDREEAVRMAQQLLEENQALKGRMQNLDKGYLHEYGTRLEAQSATAKRAYREAYESGDSDKMLEAQELLSKVAMEQEKLRVAKQRTERMEVQRQPAQQPVQQQAPAPQPAPQPDPRAQSWAEKNEWFGNDEIMTYAAFGIHRKLVEEEGFDPASDEYYTEVDRRIRAEFPQKFQTKKSGGAQVAPAGASATRSTAKQGRRSVKLSPSQIAMAKRLNVPLEEYAKYVKD